MVFLIKAAPRMLVAAAALLGWLSMPSSVAAESPARTHAGPLEAEFRGCDAAGWCRFWIESLDPVAASLYRVRPDGLPQTPCNGATCIAVRNRLNALLASMIHQAKRIALYDLRELDDGTFAATVTVNGQALAADPALVELRQGGTGTIR